MTPILPPINSTSRAQIDSPNPVPPERRLAAPLSCVNFSNTSGIWSAGMPMPVSRIVNWRSTLWLPRLRTAASRLIRPRSVNLRALPTRLISTWRRRPASARTRDGKAASVEVSSVRCLPAASGRSSVSTSATSAAGSIHDGSRSSRPASIFDRSRMSLMISSSACADSRARSTLARCGCVSDSSRTRSSMPMIPFMGVRISWLMLARNSDFRREACSACSRALTIACSACCRSLTSRRMPMKKRWMPANPSPHETSSAKVWPSRRAPASRDPAEPSGPRSPRRWASKASR